MVSTTDGSAKIKLAEGEETRAFPMTSDKVRGSAGTNVQGGYIREDYLRLLQGRKRAEIFDEMRRGDTQISMLLGAIKGPLLQAQWTIDEAEGEVQGKEVHAEFIRQALLRDEDVSFKTFIEEALTFVEFGHAVFEVTHKVVLNDPTFGSYNGIKSLGFRAQKTIERWNMDKAGKLLSVTQIAGGDLERSVDMPADFLLTFSLRKEGANYEGISLIRPCYGSWYRKALYLKINAIGIERFAVSTPIATIPVGAENDKQFDELKRALESFTAHQSNYIIKPQGWEIDLHNNAYDPQKVETSIDNEDKRMSKATMANFLELGMNSVGSYALSNDLSDFFLASLEHLASIITSAVNRHLIRWLIEAKYGPQAAYPQLKATGISDKVGKEFAEILTALGNGKWLTPSDKDEEYVRKRYGLPIRSDEGVRETGNPSPFQAQPAPGADPQNAPENPANPNLSAAKLMSRILEAHRKKTRG